MDSVSDYLDPNDGTIKGRAKGMLVGVIIAVAGPPFMGLCVLFCIMMLPAFVVMPIVGAVAPRRFALFFHNAKSERETARGR